MKMLHRSHVLSACGSAACALLAYALLACGPTPAPVPTRPTLSITDRPVASFVADFSRASGLAVVVAPEAVELAQCVRITVVAPGPLDPNALVRLVDRTLLGTALELRHTPEAVVIARREGVALPPSCEALVQREELQRRIALLRAGPILPPANTEAEAPAPASAEDLAAALAGISSDAPGHFVITRSALTQLMQPNVAARSARVVPHMEEGVVVGMRVFGIRTNSLFAKLGLMNGDLVRAIDAYPLTDPNNALEAFTTLRRSDTHTLAITRGGEPMALRYTVVEDPAPTKRARTRPAR